MASSERIVGVIGLGYVGLPVAVEFGKKVRTIGFDINTRRIEALQSGVDSTGEVTPADLKATKCEFTASPEKLKEADFFIVAVPTPIDEAKYPDLTLVKKASETVGKVLKRGDIVVYESTVYPGCTEEICGPILEKVSGLKCGVDFFLGYSPERINPGDKEHTFTKITKVVSGQTPEILKIVSKTYGSVVTAGTYEASSIKVAEAAKVIENTQRDLNIALMNELAVIFDRMNISTKEVLAAAGTKWNFLKFQPGLVGGHCIGVDPYYLTYKSQLLGYQPEVILAGRRINDSMGSHVAQKLIKLMIREHIPVSGSTVTVLGFTFKENCPDIRNSRVIDIVNELKDYGIKVQVVDPIADANEVMHEYGLELTEPSRIKPADAVILAVAHHEYRNMDKSSCVGFFKASLPKYIFVDVKSVVDARNIESSKLSYWSL